MFFGCLLGGRISWALPTMALMGMMQGAIVGELVLGGDGDGALLGAVGGAMLGSGMMGGGGGGGYGGGYNGGGGYYNNSGMGMAPPPMLMGCGVR